MRTGSLPSTIGLALTCSALLLLPSPTLAKMPLGHLDEAQPTWVGGWGFDPDHPEAEIAIHIYVDGQFAGNGETKGYRPDVNAAYGITGNHGFTFGVDIAKFGPGTHNVCAYGIDLDGEGNPAFDPCPYKVTIGCTPQCGGKNCGSDGCGGSCGSCPGGQTCDNGQCSGGPPPSGMPTGNLDAANEGMIGGWAKDPDWDGPLMVHIYVDGAMLKVLKADGWREDVGAHGFSWDPPPFGAGDHEVVAYALGVDGAGNPNGENPGLNGSPKTLKGTCNGLESDALGWCQGMAPYWVNRQKDTVWVSNDSARAGVNKSFGGTIFQIYGAGWDRNLILEHGGGAVQLSIWGYDPVGGVGWYGNDGCDPKSYPSEAACKAGGHASCSPWAHPGGAHCSNCTSQTPCGGWTPGAPWNPIQAQGPGCGWDSPANDCNAAEWQGQTFYTRLDAPFHFTSTAPPAPMPMEQWVTAHQGYLEVKYRLTYSGPYTWTPHPQEIPAIFTSFGMNQHYYYYDGDAPFSGAGVTHKAGASSGFLRYPNRPEYGHGDDYFGYVREGWWGVCDGAQERCITVASFSPVMNEVALAQNQAPGGSGYITALGYFGVKPGMDFQWTVYFFPYRYDQVVGGKTVRDIIYSLAPPDFATQPCKPACSGKQCGPDGCGGSCGSCPGGSTCDGAGQCIAGCPDNCWGKQCGPDGCGGSCGNCTPGFTCNDSGQCVQQCFGSCLGKQCGTDGCGVSCGSCAPGLTCTDAGQCVQNCVGDCTGKDCGLDGCGVSCGNCGPGLFCTGAGECADECPASCVGKECGSDGCGGDCGSCGPGLICFAGVCVEPCEPICEGKQCGPDGCGGSCGSCGFGQACAMSDWQCLPEDQVPPEERWEPEVEPEPDVVSQGDGLSQGDGNQPRGDGNQPRGDGDQPRGDGDLPGGPDGQGAPMPDEFGKCPDGFVADNGKCILVEEKKNEPAGCGVVRGGRTNGVGAAAVLLLAAALLLAARGLLARRSHAGSE